LAFDTRRSSLLIFNTHLVADKLQQSCYFFAFSFHAARRAKAVLPKHPFPATTISVYTKIGRLTRWPAARFFKPYFQDAARHS